MQLRHLGEERQFREIPLAHGTGERLERMMRGELTVVNPDGSIFRRNLTNVDSYKEISEAVGGGFELVSGFESFEDRICEAYVNDQSILNGMPENRSATQLWWPQLDESQRTVNAVGFLHGPLAIITGDDDFMGASR